MTCELSYIGFTHARAPLVIRERVQPSREQVRAVLDRLALFASGRLVLSTCERFEVYASGAKPGTSRWMGMLSDWFHVPRRLLARYAVTRSGDAVAEHMLRVAAGLDSRVLGEPQVLGQLRAAHQVALEAKSLDPTLAALARSALRTGRRVRHETHINQGRRSIASLAVEQVLPPEAPSDRHRVIVLGTGHLARDVLAALSARNGMQVVLVGRNRETGPSLAARHGAWYIELSELRSVLRSSQALIACTSAMTYVVDSSQIGTQRSTPLRIIDLCVPRNVDPDVERLAGVGLVHLDELLNRSMPAVSGLAPAVEIVRTEWNEFATWCRERAAAPRIAALIRETQKGGRTLTPAERRALHERIVRLKRDSTREEAAA